MKPVPFVRELEPDVECPEELEAIVHRCLHRNRSERFASAEALLSAFKGVWRLETDHSFGTETSLPPYRPLPEQFTVRSAAPSPAVDLELDEEALPVVPLERASYAAAPQPALRRRRRLWPVLVAVGLAVMAGAALAVRWVITTPRAAAAHPASGGGGLVDLPEEPDPRAQEEAPPAAPAPGAASPVAPPAAPTGASGQPLDPSDPDYKGNPY
jgi:hypothetical protein